MAYSNECPLCGANLDPGEKCDCGLYDYIGKWDEDEKDKSRRSNGKYENKVLCVQAV